MTNEDKMLKLFQDMFGPITISQLRRWLLLNEELAVKIEEELQSSTVSQESLDAIDHALSTDLTSEQRKRLIRMNVAEMTGPYAAFLLDTFLQLSDIEDGAHHKEIEGTHWFLYPHEKIKRLVFPKQAPYEMTIQRLLDAGLLSNKKISRKVWYSPNWKMIDELSDTL